MLKMELGFSCWQLKSFFLPFTYTILEGRITFSHPVVHKWKPLCQNLEFFCAATTTVCKITYSTSVIHVGVGPTAGVTAEKCRWSSHEFRGKKVANQKSSTCHTAVGYFEPKRCKNYFEFHFYLKYDQICWFKNISRL